MITYEIIDAGNKDRAEYGLEDIAGFLHKHLDEFGDDPGSIKKAIRYAWQEDGGRGGFVALGHENGEILGAVVVNETGMGGYIPENILVYIAVRGDQRGRGLGKELMNKTIERAEGDIALHVEPENPARHLYEKIGFTNKYLEMRYHK